MSRSPTYLSWFDDVDSYWGFAPVLFVLGWFFAGFGTVGQPHIMVGYMTMDKGDNIGRVRAYYYSWYAAFFGAAILVGMLARIIIVDDGSFDPELALPSMAIKLFPPFYIIWIITIRMPDHSVLTKYFLVEVSNSP